MRLAALAALAGLALTACGPARVPTEQVGRRIVVAALGDSVTAGSPGYEPHAARRKVLGFGEDERSQWEYWAQRADPRLSFRNCGVYGERTDEIARRLGACTAGADVLVVQGGIDDVAQGVPAERTAANLRAIVRRGKGLGLRVALADLLPWNNGYPAYRGRIERLNRLIRRIGLEEQVPVLPFHDTLADEGRPGRMPEEWTSDGDHPSIEGYRRLGELAFRLP